MHKTPFLSLALLLLLPLLSVSLVAQSGVRAVVVNDNANIRIAPALGAEVIATVSAGYFFEVITARSPDNQWIRVDFNGNEGWVNLAPLSVIQGDVGALPVADPRTIPYGGFESPRAGLSNATSPFRVRITNGLRVRAGPSEAYPTLANMFANTIVPVFGRTASNGWVQVLFEGTLGWASAQFIEPLDGLVLAQLPIDGIVADQAPISQDTATDYVDTLKLLLSRIDLAQPALDAIRAIWTDASLNGRVSCHFYPPQPSDYNIPTPLLAAYFETLNPLQTDFNDAMANLRRAIELLIETCNQPGLGNPVGQATIIGALNIINTADGQFASLRQRLRELIPPDVQPGPNECLFTFRGRSVIIPRISLAQIVRQRFDPRNRTFGFCIDLVGGQVIAMQSLVIRGNVEPFLVLSQFDNPTNFVATGRASGIAGSELIVVGQIVVPATGPYLFIISHAPAGDVQESLSGEVAFTILEQTPFGQFPTLQYDPITDTVGFSFLGIPIPSSGQSQGNTSNANPTIPGATCPSLGLTCNQLFSCQEAYACLQAGNTSLDADGDGVPCPNLCAP